MQKTPFTLAALEASLATRLSLPADEVRSIAQQVCERYDRTGPTGTRWRLRSVSLFETTGLSYQAYELCRADWLGGVYFSRDQETAQALADALNDLEGLT
jgi:hypothetical protein